MEGWTVGQMEGQLENIMPLVNSGGSIKIYNY